MGYPDCLCGTVTICEEILFLRILGQIYSKLQPRVNRKIRNVPRAWWLSTANSVKIQETKQHICESLAGF